MGAAEDTGLPDNYADVVSISLVPHEMPQEATRAMLREAYRIIKPGGAFSFMDMDPASPVFQGIVKQPITFALFKTTEPVGLGQVA